MILASAMRNATGITILRRTDGYLTASHRTCTMRACIYKVATRR